MKTNWVNQETGFSPVIKQLKMSNFIFLLLVKILV